MIFLLLDKCRLFFKITQVRAGQKSLISVHLHFQTEWMPVVNSSISRGFISFYRAVFAFLLWRVKVWMVLLHFHVDVLPPCPGLSLSWSICMSEDHKKELSSLWVQKQGCFSLKQTWTLDLFLYDLSLENGLFQMAKQKKLRKQMN